MAVLHARTQEPRKTRHGSRATTNGGYVVGAGSTCLTGRYSAVRNHTIALLPAWLAGALTPPPRSAVETAAAGPPRDAGAYLRAILTAETAAVARARPGNRHTTLLAAAVTLGRLVAGGELVEHDARAALRNAADIHIGVDNMTPDEVGATIDDGLRYGARRPRYLSPTWTASGTSGVSASEVAALAGNAKGPHTSPPCTHDGP